MLFDEYNMYVCNDEECKKHRMKYENAETKEKVCSCSGNNKDDKNDY